MKELKIELIEAERREREIEIRNKRAMEYIKKCRKRRIKEREEKRKMIFCGGMSFLAIIILCI